MKKVAFVQPEIGFKPFSALGTWPLGIISLATTLKQAHPDYDVQCFEEDSRRVLKRGKLSPFLLEADVVGISSLTSTAPRAYALADELRDARARGETNPNLQVILGGMHVSAMPNEAIAHADTVLKGEGEESIVRLVDEAPQGIIIGERVKGLDSLANPNYSLLGYKKKRITDWMYGTLASASTSRGCSYCCDFCSVWTTFGRNVRFESPEKTFEKLKELRQKGFKRVFFHDDNFSEDKENREELFRKLTEAKLGMDFIVQDRIDLLQDADYVDRMALAGNSMVMFAIESADEEFLEAHNKQLDLGKVGRGVENLKRNNIIPYAFCMINPETPETTRKTINLLRSLDIKYAQFTIPTPLPGTVLYQQTKDRIKNGWEYFNGLTLVTETGKKMHDAAEHLSRTWREFYSPNRAFYDVLKGNLATAVLRFYGNHVGRKILGTQPAS